MGYLIAAFIFLIWMMICFAWWLFKILVWLCAVLACGILSLIFQRDID